VICGVAWINSTNQFDAAAGFGGRRESGFGREGGREGLYAYTHSQNAPTNDLIQVKALTGKTESAGTEIDRTAKLFIGGKQAVQTADIRPQSFHLTGNCSHKSAKETVRISATQWKPPKCQRMG